MHIEKTIKDIDFSQNSKVKESLRQKLLINRQDELSMDELDDVTAAGIIFHPPYPYFTPPGRY